MSLQSFPSLAFLSTAAAKSIAALSQEAIAQRGRFTVALSGGETPKPLYELLGTEYRTTIDWNRTHLFWGDERYVPHDDPASNYRMVKESLLDKIAIPEANVHPIPTSFPNPEEAREDYSQTLLEFFGESVPSFDLILLGLGGDGHTASIFPATPTQKTLEGTVIVTESPVKPLIRISLTMSVLNNARNVYFLVAGAGKREILKDVLAEEGSPNSKYPSARVKPVGELVWFCS